MNFRARPEESSCGFGKLPMRSSVQFCVSDSEPWKGMSISDLSVLSSVATSPDHKANQNRHPFNNQQHRQLPIVGLRPKVVSEPGPPTAIRAGGC